MLASSAQLALAAAFSQAIYIITMPLVTRLYSPDQFGVYSLFSAFIVMGLPLSTLGLHVGLSLSARQSECLRLAKVIQVIAFVMSFFIALLLGAYLLLSERQKGLPAVLFALTFWVVMLCSALAQVARFWAIRQGSIGRANRLLLGNSAGAASGRLLFGWLGWTSVGLPLAALVGSLIGVTGVRFVSWRNSLKLIPFVLARYREFPLHATPQQLMNATAKALPVLFLGWFFDDEVVGQYALALAVLALPSAVIGKSIGEALLPTFRKSLAVVGQVRKEWQFNTAVLSVAGLVPLLIIVFFGPAIFTLAFGTHWSSAGLLATVMAPWLFCGLINSPSLSVMTILRQQAVLSKLNAISLLGRLLALGFSALLGATPVTMIAAYSVVGIFHNAAVIIVAKSKLRGA